nr:MAG TPA: hypothetical protein [Caudoviricetes sp.]
MRRYKKLVWSDLRLYYMKCIARHANDTLELL